MGDAADMMLDGTLDSETGELIDGESPGFPRTKRGKHYGGLAHEPHPCPHCERVLKSAIGVADHIRAKHPQEGHDDG